MPAIESSFSLHATKGPVSFTDDAIAPLMVVNEYLTMMEGPAFWQKIRGQGLAYSCNLNFNVEQGLLYFAVYRSPDAFKAFQAAKSIVEKYGSGEMTFEPAYVIAARSGTVFSVISTEVRSPAVIC